MIRFYITNKLGKLDKINNLKKNCWIEMINPTNQEIKEISVKTNTDEDLLTKLLDDEELPRVEEGDNATLIVVDTPYLTDKEYKHKYDTDPIGLIISKSGYFITVSLKDHKLLSDFKRNKIKYFDSKYKSKFVIQILLRIASLYQKELSAINNEINIKEKKLYKSTSNKDLLELLDVEKTLVYFITSLNANDVVLDKLSKGKLIQLYEDDKDLLEDAIIENKQAIEMANIYREILSSMTDTYATIISNNLNDVMKFLASVTIIFSVPTMISSFLGMNVNLGFISSSNISFIVIIGISALLAIIIAIIFKKKNML